MIRLVLAGLLVAGCATGHASAQESDSAAQRMRVLQQAREMAATRRGGEDIVNQTVSMAIPLERGADVAAQHEAALKSFYQMAAKSCGVVLETVADSCEITSVTSNSNARQRGETPELTVTGQMTMKVKFKGASAPQ